MESTSPDVVAAILQTVRQILELGWPAIVLIQLYLVWKDDRDARKIDRQEYDRLMQQYISDLREIAGLKKPLTPLVPETTPPGA